MAVFGFSKFYLVDKDKSFGGELRPANKMVEKKVCISKIRGYGCDQEACPVIFRKFGEVERPLKSVRYEGFAGGLKKKVVVDILVVAFMSPENGGRPGPAPARPGLAAPSVAATQPLCGFHTDHAVRHGRRGRPGRHARKSEATGFHPRPAPHAHTPKIATLRCGGIRPIKPPQGLPWDPQGRMG